MRRCKWYVCERQTASGDDVVPGDGGGDGGGRCMNMQLSVQTMQHMTHTQFNSQRKQLAEAPFWGARQLRLQQFVRVSAKSWRSKATNSTFTLRQPQ